MFVDRKDRSGIYMKIVTGGFVMKIRSRKPKIHLDQDIQQHLMSKEHQLNLKG